LAEGELLADGAAREAQFWTSADPVHFRNILPILWNTAGIVRSFNR
jgi:glutamate racemase